MYAYIHVKRDGKRDWKRQQVERQKDKPGKCKCDLWREREGNIYLYSTFVCLPKHNISATSTSVSLYVCAAYLSHSGSSGFFFFFGPRNRQSTKEREREREEKRKSIGKKYDKISICPQVKTQYFRSFQTIFVIRVLLVWNHF